jgi:hypothetical protein
LPPRSRPSEARTDAVQAPAGSREARIRTTLRVWASRAPDRTVEFPLIAGCNAAPVAAALDRRTREALAVLLERPATARAPGQRLAAAGLAIRPAVGLAPRGLINRNAYRLTNMASRDGSWGSESPNPHPQIGGLIRNGHAGMLAGNGNGSFVCQRTRTRVWSLREGRLFAGGRRRTATNRPL